MYMKDKLYVSFVQVSGSSSSGVIFYLSENQM